MRTVTSLSGGRSSAYMAIHFPTDINAFSLVCIDSHNAGRGLKPIDPAIKKQVNDRLQKHCSHWPEFRATSEDPVVLKTILDLEQFLGKEVVWLRGMGWEEAIVWRQSIPNETKRWCTTWLKIVPLFEYCLKYEGLPVKMNIGYRADEPERKGDIDPILHYPVRCEYRPKSMTWQQRWEYIEWQVPQFPMIENRVMRPAVMKYWSDKPIEFALDSNCQMCFWKNEQQLRKNFETNPAIMYWGAIQEELAGYTWKKRMSLLEISRLGIQQEFIFGGGAGCKAGVCTD